MANDVCDASLYGHRHSYQRFRQRPDDVIPTKGTPRRIAREAAELEDDVIEMTGGYR